MVVRRKNVEAKYAYQRPVLTDVLPFEVPPSFSNGGFFSFLVRYDVRIEQRGAEKWVVWHCNSSAVDAVISIIFGTSLKDTNNFRTETEVRDGSTRHVRKWRVPTPWTRPYTFNISHKERDFRQLTVIHPRNQLFLADFYNKNSSQIIYHCNKSEYSIRRPNSLATTTKFSDRLHKARRSSLYGSVEEAEKEYENLGSFFVYKKYSNIFKFYEHYKYHNAEKKFDKLLKLDISKCFDSIYTHSLPWVVLGAEACKANLELSINTFGGRFDKLMQDMNQGETNGIVIGPEFSRVFSEIILQGVDKKLQEKLLFEDGLRNKVDYEIFRYVDDYFIFHNDGDFPEKAERYLSIFLKEMKLNLNSGKSESYEKPIITRITIAKNKVRSILTNNIVIFEETRINPDDNLSELKVYNTSVDPNRFIVDFKTVLSETGVTYRDILNYTYSAIERKVKTIFDRYSKNATRYQDPPRLLKALMGILEFCFFTYASNPRVNFSVRLTRILATMVDRLNDLGIASDLKGQLFKYAFDNIVRQLKRSHQREFREVETLYLILGLKKLGREYHLSEDNLARYLGIVTNSAGEFSRPRHLDYFSITTSLLYMGGRKRYAKLRKFIETDIIATFQSRSAYAYKDAELVMLFLDLQCCPHISTATLHKISDHYSLGVFELPFIKSAANHWFTNWTNFDLSFELDKKRTREVY
ncbi:antiviral reverse transcriptase Drt3b [Shinella sp.]|jgi:hypothetical protein|uniref:antiviral reverse transcriptase Drt3b n=1 Tax=Shinella sp. TaxID=1870904 RepID=UPI003F7091C5